MSTEPDPNPPFASGRLSLSGKFRRDLYWNYASFTVLGVGGVLINVIVGAHYGAATLGVFNQVYARGEP